MEKSNLDWLMKCRQCKHYYQVQSDADEVRCRLKYCRYEPSKEVVEFEQLQQELAESEEMNEHMW